MRRSEKALDTKLRRSRGIPDDSLIHGTPSGYGNWYCRCDKCKAAQRIYRQLLKRRRP